MPVALPCYVNLWRLVAMPGFALRLHTRPKLNIDDRLASPSFRFSRRSPSFHDGTQAPSQIFGAEPATLRADPFVSRLLATKRARSSLCVHSRLFFRSSILTSIRYRHVHRGVINSSSEPCWSVPSTSISAASEQSTDAARTRCLFTEAECQPAASGTKVSLRSPFLPCQLPAV